LLVAKSFNTDRHWTRTIQHDPFVEGHRHDL